LKLKLNEDEVGVEEKKSAGKWGKPRLAVFSPHFGGRFYARLSD